VPVTSLVTLDDVHSHLNLPDSSADAEIMGFIEAATAYVEFQTGPIIPKQFTEVHDGGGPSIVLDNPPVLSVESVTEYVGATGYTLTQSELGSPTGAYAFSIDDAARGILTRRWSGGLVGPFVGGVKNVQVTYTAGRASVPADIRMAVLEDIRGLYTQTQYGRPGASFGGGIGSEAAEQWSAVPMHAFPRLAALLEGPTRTPSLA